LIFVEIDSDGNYINKSEINNITGHLLFGITNLRNFEFMKSFINKTD
jgi:hypothetical protein